MSERSFWKEMQINDMLVIDTIRKYGRDTIYFKDKPLKFRFGEKLETVLKKIEACGLTNLGIEDIKRGDENLVNDLINNLNNNSDDDLDPDEF